MYVTRHSHVVDPHLVEQLWVLYEQAYRRTAEASVTQEMLFRTDFEEQLSDHTNRIWVVWDEGTAAAMTLIATDITRTRWLSSTYFERHYPTRYRHRRVHYIVWAVVDPAYAMKGAVIRLARGALALEAEEGALLVFDVPEVNQPREQGGASELLIRLSRMVGNAELIPLETQRYYAIDFAGAEVPAEEEPRLEDERPGTRVAATEQVERTAGRR